MSRGEVVLGIDPGLASLGWGVVLREGNALRYLHDGTLHTKPADGSDEARALALAGNVRTLAEAARPTLVVIERWVFYPDAEPNAAHALGLVIGALVAVTAPAPHLFLRAQDLRSGLGLPKNGTKEDTRNRVQAVLGQRGRSFHSADALAVAIVGAGRHRR